MPSDDWTARTEARTRYAHARRRAARTTRVPADMTIRDAAAADFRHAPDYRDLINKRTARGPQYCWRLSAYDTPGLWLGSIIGGWGSAAQRFNTGPWQSYNLTYRIYNGTPDVANEVAIVDQAFVWQAVSPLRFTQTTSPPISTSAGRQATTVTVRRLTVPARSSPRVLSREWRPALRRRRGLEHDRRKRRPAQRCDSRDRSCLRSGPFTDH
jgi:hypothetical protein